MLMGRTSSHDEFQIILCSATTLIFNSSSNINQQINIVHHIVVIFALICAGNNTKIFTQIQSGARSLVLSFNLNLKSGLYFVEYTCSLYLT